MPFERSIVISGATCLGLFDREWREPSNKNCSLDCLTQLFPPGAHGLGLSVERWSTGDGKVLRIELRRSEEYEIWLAVSSADLSYRLPQSGCAFISLHPAELLIIPPDPETGLIVDLRTTDALRVRISSSLVAQGAAEVHGRPEQRAGMLARKVRDTILQHLILALVAEDSSVDAPALAVADNIGLALAVHLVASFGSGDGKEVSLPVTMPLPGWRLKRVLDYIEAYLRDDLSLAVLSDVVGLSRMHFGTQFREATGMSPHRYVLNRRVAVSCVLLRDTEDSIEEVARRSGFKSDTHFIKVFRRIVGVSPGTWRRANKAT